MIFEPLLKFIFNIFTWFLDQIPVAPVLDPTVINSVEYFFTQMAKINQFFPIDKFFSILYMWFVFETLILLVKFADWLWERFPGN